MVTCKLCGMELESELAPHSGEDCIAHVKATYPWVCEQLRDEELNRCLEIVSGLDFNTVKNGVMNAMLKDL